MRKSSGLVKVLDQLPMCELFDMSLGKCQVRCSGTKLDNPDLTDCCSYFRSKP